MGLFYAYDLHQDNDASDIRFVVEARILARQDDATIAGKIGTLAETIAWYERLFFCVRDRLNVSDFIHRHNLASQRIRAVAERPVRTLRPNCSVILAVRRLSSTRCTAVLPPGTARDPQPLWRAISTQ